VTTQFFHIISVSHVSGTTPRSADAKSFLEKLCTRCGCPSLYCRTSTSLVSGPSAVDQEPAEFADGLISILARNGPAFPPLSLWGGSPHLECRRRRGSTRGEGEALLAEPDVICRGSMGR